MGILRAKENIVPKKKPVPNEMIAVIIVAINVFDFFDCCDKIPEKFIKCKKSVADWYFVYTLKLRCQHCQTNKFDGDQFAR